MLSKKAKYALKALIVLCKGNNQSLIGLAEIAAQQKIPRKFLETILGELKNLGYLNSRPGKGGGYSLQKRPEDISIGQVIRLMDGRVSLTACTSRTDFKLCSDCQMPDTCIIRPLMVKVGNATDHILDTTTLADIVNSDPVLLSLAV